MVNISIIIPAYNSDIYIEECLDSIKNQNLLNEINYEIVVGVDGCMKTLNKLNEIKSKYDNLSVISFNENYGCYITINTLLDFVKYENILIFGSDDIMFPNMLQRLSENINNGDIIRFKFVSFTDINNKKTYSYSNFYACGCILIKKNVFDLCGGYKSKRHSEDLELLYRLKNYVKIHYINETLFYYRVHPKNLTNTISIKERLKYNQSFKENIYNEDDIKIVPVKVNNQDIKIL